MEKIITPKKIEEASTRDGSVYLRVQDQNNQWYSVWDSEDFSKLMPDVPIRVDIIKSKDGRFTNLKVIGIISPTDKPDWPAIRAEKRESISKLNALNNAVLTANAWLQAGKITNHEEYSETVKYFFDFYFGLNNENGKEM